MICMELQQPFQDQNNCVADCRHHYTSKIAVMIQQLLAQLQAPGHLSNRVGQTTFIMKTVVVAAVSSVFGSILVLNIVRAYQLNKKRRALTRAGKHRQLVNMATADFGRSI
jgi:hypothetical protein